MKKRDRNKKPAAPPPESLETGMVKAGKAAFAIAEAIRNNPGIAEQALVLGLETVGVEPQTLAIVAKVTKAPKEVTDPEKVLEVMEAIYTPVFQVVPQGLAGFIIVLREYYGMGPALLEEIKYAYLVDMQKRARDNAPRIIT